MQNLKYNKAVNETEKQTHREHTSGYEWREERGRDNTGVRDLKTNYCGII